MNLDDFVWRDREYPVVALCESDLKALLIGMLIGPGSVVPSPERLRDARLLAERILEEGSK